MNRRNFLQLLTYGAVAVGATPKLFAKATMSEDAYFPVDSLTTALQLNKKEDIYLDEQYRASFYSVVKKLNLVQRHVGFGNYNVLSFDQAISTARWSSKIESFTDEELAFMEYIFYYNPNVHGFYGERTCQSITEAISKKEIIKIPHSGHYLFKERSLATYNSMVKDIGNSIILTSGVRSVMKQMKLFLDKLDRTDLNLSKASISLAPPAYSYHSNGDFDVGKKGFGYDNFTERFASTEEFNKMIKLTYVDIRYTVNNKDGVRYEPWHVTVV
ncbi:M15 family metallopeptidase [Candidatus Marinarcus aquaticus]|uniref:Twin-arginine translocation pathway signal protein n=1 Tax=Candidatus Marinarcus aquaticus TaxID=2044504 RepID=A0A4Q0XPF1_9BACT|nr:M15 family metallopeptidase [Candidatus Marinarcus aquaticus]RXJ55472.1 twin-arginine translocation pathway signal protein [Candidatus Marinarcus aquaticus]